MQKKVHWNDNIFHFGFSGSYNSKTSVDKAKK